MNIIPTFSGYGWLLVPVGLFLGLLGYRVYRVSLLLIGVLAGLVLGSWVGSRTGNNQLYLVLGLVIGAILGLVSYFLARFSFFIPGMVGGFVLSSFIIEQGGLDLKANGEIILMLTTSLVTGMLTVLLYRTLVILFTSIVGSFLIYQTTIHYFPRNADNWSWILYVILLLVFVIVQMIGRRHHSDPV